MAAAGHEDAKPQNDETWPELVFGEASAAVAAVAAAHICA